jgi:hypothetical protein
MEQRIVEIKKEISDDDVVERCIWFFKFDLLQLSGIKTCIDILHTQTHTHAHTHGSYRNE